MGKNDKSNYFFVTRGGGGLNWTAFTRLSDKIQMAINDKSIFFVTRGEGGGKVDNFWTKLKMQKSDKSNFLTRPWVGVGGGQAKL